MTRSGRVGRRLTVRPELGKSGQERRGRVVPLAPALVEELSGWGRREGLMLGAERDRVWYPWVIRAWEAAGVPRAVWEHHEIHCLRHGFVTALAALGVPHEVRAALVGHTVGVTTDTYTDPVALWPAMVEAVALVPPVGVGVASELDAARTRFDERTGP